MDNNTTITADVHNDDDHYDVDNDEREDDSQLQLENKLAY